MVNGNKENLGLPSEQYSLVIPAEIWLMIGALIIEASSDTTRTSNVVLAAACIEQDCVKRAQAGLDHLSGNKGQLRNFADLEQLQYIQAAAKEALRWGDLVDVGANHMDLEFEQFNFPKGTLFTWNA